MRNFLFILTLLMGQTLFISAQNTITHEKWTALLQKYVDPYGNVNYKAFKEHEAELDDYLKFLSDNSPHRFWSVDDQKAYWINAYNAFTIKLVLKYYPIKSIMDIKEGDKDAWHISFAQIGDKLYTLDYIEKTMLLGQFNDSRIHFVINCSAKSCPPLKNKAYEAENLNVQMRLATKEFINNNRLNILSEDHLQLSQLFNWYAKDFINESSSVQKYINENTPHLEISPTASMNYLNYNWNLNGK